MLDLKSTLEHLVRESIAWQKTDDASLLRGPYSARGFINEFCTVRLGARRRAGHTTAIAHCMRKWPKSIVVVPYEASRDLYVEGHMIPADRVFTKARVETHALRGQEFNVVFVDNAFYFSRRALANLQEELSAHVGCGPVLLVLVQ